jgi:hypothetical protein
MTTKVQARVKAEEGGGGAEKQNTGLGKNLGDLALITNGDFYIV